MSTKKTKSSKGSNHPVDRLFGLLSLSKSVDEIIDEMRGARPAQPREKAAEPSR